MQKPRIKVLITNIGLFYVNLLGEVYIPQANFPYGDFFGYFNNGIISKESNPFIIGAGLFIANDETPIINY